MVSHSRQPKGKKWVKKATFLPSGTLFARIPGSRPDRVESGAPKTRMDLLRTGSMIRTTGARIPHDRFEG